jgi:hypothetical protein
MVRINYFLYHIRTSSKIGEKLETSLAFLQLETGLLQPFLTAPYEIYGSLATTTLLKCIWAQTEPFGLILQPDTSQYWLPKLQGPNDIAIVEDMRSFYNSEACKKINRCRLYFQVTTIYDLITYDGSQVHPEYTSNNRVKSRRSTIHWVNFKKPPKKYLKLWNEYITRYVAPRIPTNITKWNRNISPHYQNTYYLSTRTGRIYHQISSDTYQMHEATLRQPGNKNTIFQSQFTVTQITPEIRSSLQSIDVTHSNQRIKLLCHSQINEHGPKAYDPPQNKYHYYRTLPKSLRRLCGKISFPPDGGIQLMDHLRETQDSLIGVSDASIIEGNGTHAWILTTSDTAHLEDPYMKIEGSGPVDGDTSTMSSSRGELQGQTALAIITKKLINEHNAHDIPITFFSDNQGVQRCCSNSKLHRIGHHRKANIDLQLEHNKSLKDLNISHKWVKGHQDKDQTWDTIEELRDLNLTLAATLNIYCDRKATEEHQRSVTDPSCDVLPAEKWALFSRVPTTKKITGKLNDGIIQTLQRDELLTYL